MTRLPFLKVEGGGNDFVLLDRPDPAVLTPARIRTLCDRHRGIGSDGLLALNRGKGKDGDAVVRFYNPDGRAAGFCGNGARCVALLLLNERPRAREVHYRLGRFACSAKRASGGRIAVLLPEPTLRSPAGGSPPPPVLPGRAPRVPSVWVHAGVPHWIVPVAALSSCDLAVLAPPLRSWRGFGPGGSNVDFVRLGAREVEVRTWERGVEGETESCGSGLLAAGWWAGHIAGRSFPVRLRSRGGESFLLRRDARGLWLEGPARLVYSGEVTLP